MGWAKTIYIEALHAEAKQERRKAGMAVNPPGLMLKRFQQAKKMHGTHSQVGGSNDSTPMAEEVPPTVLHRFGGRSSSSGLGSSTDGNNATVRERQKFDTERDGQSEER